MEYNAVLVLYNATAIFGIINTFTIAKWLKETFAFKIICEIGLYSMDVYILESFF